MKLPLYTVNAFASAPFTGNPAAICPLEDWLEDSLLQAIAAQNNLAETAYLVRKTAGQYHLRWFTPTVEVPLCGHATLASAYVLKECLGEKSASITFDSKSGPLIVDCSEDKLAMDFPAVPAKACPTPEWFRNAFGANPTEFHQALYGMAVFPSEEIIAALEPDFSILAKTPNSNVIVTAPSTRYDFVSRFFAPASGIDEDPVTGSAHCTLTPYWSKVLGKSQLSAKQISPRGGEVDCELKGDRVLLSGMAQLYSEATIYV